MLQLIGVIIAFILVILLICFKINFGFALIIGAISLAIFSFNEINLVEIPLKMIGNQEFLIDTALLAILMTLIYMLAKIMQETGAIKKLIDSLRTIFTKGGTMAAVPAIYGLMPVPGGALFSAPVVEEEGEEFNIHVDKKNFFNVWFRHIWFPVYPISITILTTAKLAEIEVADLIRGNFLTFVAMVLLGFILLTFFVNKNKDFIKSKKMDFKCIKKECKGLLFILPPIIPVFFGFFNILFNVPLEICFIFGVITSIIILLYLVKTPKSEFKELFKKSITWKFAMLMIGIMVFKEIFDITNSSIAIFDMIQGFNVPILLMLILLPLILGLVTGYLLVSITLSYPLLLPFFDASGLSVIGFTSLIFMSGFLGYLISPIHLCNVVSSSYLKTETIKMYPIFIPTAIVLLLIHVLIVLYVL